MSVNPHTERITKRSWNRLLLPIVIVSAAFAALLGFLANFWDAFTLPAFTLAGWLYFRSTTPPSGSKAVSINGNPKIKALLAWLAFILLLTGTWAFVDTIVFGNSIYSPIDASQVLLFVALIALLLTGVMVIERRFPSTPTRPNHDANNDDG